MWNCFAFEHFHTFCIFLFCCVGRFANCGVMTCHTFKVLREVTNLWGQILICTRTDSTEKLETVSGIFLLFGYCGYCCLGSLYCPKSKWIIDELVASFELLSLTSHLDNVYQLDTFLAILLIELLIVWNCFAVEYFHIFCFDVFYFLPTVV